MVPLGRLEQSGGGWLLIGCMLDRLPKKGAKKWGLSGFALFFLFFLLLYQSDFLLVFFFFQWTTGKAFFFAYEKKKLGYVLPE